MNKGFSSRRKGGVDVKRAKVNRSSATTLTSYKPPQRAANPASSDKLALVVPALNEAGNLKPLLRRALSALQRVELPWELIVVDDDSRDGTEEIVAAIGREDPRVRLLVRRGELGLSGAILHGWRHTNATLLGVMDADGQHPPELLPFLVRSVINGGDLAIASRYAPGGRCAWNPVRRLLSWAAVMAARPLQPEGAGVRDPLSGFFIVRRTCIESVLFQTTGFKLLLEILVRARIATVEEIPFAFARRRIGMSKVSARVMWDYFALLVRLYRARFATPRIPQAASGD